MRFFGEKKNRIVKNLTNIPKIKKPPFWGGFFIKIDCKALQSV